MLELEVRNAEIMYTSLSAGRGGYIGGFSNIVREIRQGESFLEVMDGQRFRIRTTIMPGDCDGFDFPNGDFEDYMLSGNVDIPYREIEKLLGSERYQFVNSCHRQMIIKQKEREFVLNLSASEGISNTVFTLDSYFSIKSADDFAGDAQEYARVLGSVLNAIHFLGKEDNYSKKTNPKTFKVLLLWGRDFKQEEDENAGKE